MQEQTIALNQIQSLLGYDAFDDAVWQQLVGFKQVAREHIGRIWALHELNNEYNWAFLHTCRDRNNPENQARLEQAYQALRIALGDQVSSHAASFMLRSQWLGKSSTTHWNDDFSDQVEQTLLQVVCAYVLEHEQPSDWVRRLAQRIVLCLDSLMESGYPSASWCLEQLMDCQDQQVDVLFDAMSMCDFARAWAVLIDLSGWQVRQDHQALQADWHKQGQPLVYPLLRRAVQRGTLNSSMFQKLLEHTDRALYKINYLSDAAEMAQRDPQERRELEQILDLLDEVQWGLLCDFRPESFDSLQGISVLRGGRYLLRLAEEMQRQGIHALKHEHYYISNSARPDQVIGKLLSCLQRRDDDDRESLVHLLKQIEPQVLLAILPLCQAYQQELCAALGWPGLPEMYALIQDLEQQSPHNSLDPHAGVIHAQTIIARAAAMDEAHLQTLLKNLSGHNSALQLVRAALGLNRTEIRRLFGRRNALAARAMGLLPLTKPNELSERFLSLSRYLRESNSSNASRKPLERAAARAGLMNLALQAGFSDATRLEWSMHKILEDQGIAIGRTWEIEGYTLTLVLRDGEPALTVNNGKRLLKRTPSLVVRDYAYRAVRETLELAQDQMRRYRQAFLDAMRTEQALQPEELALLRSNPLAVDLLERLVLIDEAGSLGLFRAEDCSLEGRFGERVLIQGSVRVVHAYHLAMLGELHAWQREIVQRQVVQPFKQVFRELYLLTPAEENAVYASNRLAGRQLKGRQMMAVLANMGWRSNYSQLQKSFYEHGFAAYFEVDHVNIYNNDIDNPTQSGALYFLPLQYQAGKQEQRLKLNEIPPLVFSEVMRDLDLVTVIAHQSEEDGASREVIQRRADLLRITIGSLGIQQARVDEPYVLVDGKLASYRIQLTTGAIYLQSGQYLCIVPSAKQQKAIFVPYAEQGEQLVSEIISKVLLLANDTSIKDETILAQIDHEQKRSFAA
jgi:hypothetical protein